MPINQIARNKKKTFLSLRPKSHSALSRVWFTLMCFDKMKKKNFKKFQKILFFLQLPRRSSSWITRVRCEQRYHNDCVELQRHRYLWTVWGNAMHMQNVCEWVTVVVVLDLNTITFCSALAPLFGWTFLFEFICATCFVLYEDVCSIRFLHCDSTPTASIKVLNATDDDKWKKASKTFLNVPKRYTAATTLTVDEAGIIEFESDCVCACGWVREG